MTAADIKRELCLTNLMLFTRYFFKSQYRRKYVIGRHHEIIANALQRVIEGECKRLIINIAPRYGKTELAVKNFIAYGLALNASAKFIHLSYSDSLALDNSEAIKDLVTSEDYQELFPEVQIKQDSKAKEKWYTTKGGGVLARAAGGSVTGFGAGEVDDPDMDEFAEMPFGGAIVIDDPIKPEDADSDTMRVRVNERFDSTIRNRVNSRNTPIIVIMQRLHPEDLSGYLQRENEQDEWEVISLPCIYFDEKGERRALWEFKETLEELDAQRKANEVVFERQKQQNPAPKTGLMFPVSELNFYDPAELDEEDLQHIFVDPANLGGDFFAAINCKLKGNRIYVHDVLFNKDGSDVNEIAVPDMVLRNNVNFLSVESVLGWKETHARIRDTLYEHDYQGEVRAVKQRTNKHVRITNRQSFIRNNFYFRKDYKNMPQYKAFMDNLTSYLKVQEPGKANKNDDAPDVCEMAGAWFEKQFPELWVIKINKEEQEAA